MMRSTLLICCQNTLLGWLIKYLIVIIIVFCDVSLTNNHLKIYKSDIEKTRKMSRLRVFDPPRLAPYQKHRRYIFCVEVNMGGARHTFWYHGEMESTIMYTSKMDPNYKWSWNKCDWEKKGAWVRGWICTDTVLSCLLLLETIPFMALPNQLLAKRVALLR